jgi:hypothetical protein
MATSPLEEIASRYAKTEREFESLMRDLKILSNMAYKDDHTGELYLAGECIEDGINQLKYVV